MNPDPLVTNLTAVQIKDFVLLVLVGVNLILTFFLFLASCPPTTRRPRTAQRPRPNLRIKPEATTPTIH